MAHIDSIWLSGGVLASGEMKVYVKLKPAGEVQLNVPIPKKFFNALIGIAQTAADAHESQMRAEILGDTVISTPPKQESGV